MKNFASAAMLICGFFVSAMAQKELTLEESITKAYTEFYPQGINQLQWIPGGSNYSFISDEDSPSLMRQSAESETAQVVLSLQELNEISKAEPALKSFPRIQWKNAETIIFQRSGKTLSLNVNTKQVEEVFSLPEGAEHVKVNDQFLACAYIFNDNIIIQKADKSEVKVTSDGGKGIVYGQSVHRSEFGIHEGFFWSNDGKKLAFYRMDESMVDEYPLVDISVVPAKINNIKYPMAGRTSHQVKLGVFDLGGSPIIYMNTEGYKEQYLTSVGWTPDAKSIIIGLLNRDQNHLKVNRYNAKDGRLEKPLFEEKHEKYVEPEHAPWFIPGNDKQFLWMSEREGYQHLYLYDIDGKLIRPITKGLWEVHEIYGFDQTGNYLFVRGTGATNTSGRWPTEELNGMHRFTYMIDFELGGLQLVDSLKGTHTALLSDDGKYLIDDFSSIDVPRESTLYSVVGKELRILYSADDPLADYGIRKPELFNFSVNGTTTLYGRMIKPNDFDSTKKYPVLVYVYGGPHAQMVTNRYLAGAPLWMYWFANQGYIVATIDNRGSANRGLEFEQTTFRSLGSYEIGDQLSLVNYLKGRPFVDSERFAIHGWSYGGFMTINMMLSFPGTFKAGVAGGPVCDWSMYEVMYTERYMDTPETNKEGYEKSNLVERAENLQDDLLVIHGTIDDVVVWQHSQAFTKSCIDNKVQLDYFMYPGHPHNVRGIDRVHLMTKVLSYIDDKVND